MFKRFRYDLVPEILTKAYSQPNQTSNIKNFCENLTFHTQGAQIPQRQDKRNIYM